MYTIFTILSSKFTTAGASIVIVTTTTDNASATILTWIVGDTDVDTSTAITSRIGYKSNRT